MSIKNASQAIMHLHGITKQLNGLKLARKIYAPQIAPSFNPIGLLSPYENDLSRLLADLLSPQGTHEQGWVFMQKFLQVFALKEAWQRPENRIVIETEAPTCQGRRIDIKISFYSADSGELLGILAVENKPWANDQDGQLADYAQDLQNAAGNNYLLLYLSGWGKAASSYSTKGMNREKLLEGSYTELRLWLERCASCCQAPSVRFFLQSFIQYIDYNFLGVKDMTENQMLIDEIVSHPQSLASAIAIESAIVGVKTRLLKKLEVDFRNLARNERPEWEVEVDIERYPDSKYKGITVRLPDWNAFRLRFAFEQGSCNQPSFGVCKIDEQVADKKEIYAAVALKFRNAKSSDYWPWYEDMKPFCWDCNAEMWLNVQNGKTAREIFDNLNALYLALRDGGQLDLLR